MSIFNSSRHVLDYQFLLKNEDYEQLITKIDVKNYNWLNFSIPDNEKLDLFKQGALAASEFLKKFNWKKYKELRKSLITKQIGT
jgi:NTE family protein